MHNSFIAKLQSFVEFSPGEIAMLERATAMPMRYRPRQDIIREGDKTGPVFVVLEGWACRYKILPSGTRQITAFLMPGDACDLHIGMLEEMDHSMQALTPARVAAIPRGTMDRLMRDHASVARAMYLAQLVDEATLRAWIVSMGRRSSIERVAHLLCELYLRAHLQGVVADELVELPLSQIVLADALGMTPVHINRVLRDLREAGALQLSRGRIVVADTGKLVQIAGFDENYLHRRINR